MIEIIRPGMLTTVQDLGRFHHRAQGVVVSGALDEVAQHVANWMVGNSADSAALEITLGQIQLRFLHKHRFALTGADCDADLDGKKIKTWWSYVAQAGQVLRLRVPARGMRTMMAVSGGFDVPLMLGSFSTNLKAGFGGWMGRALRQGDMLPVADEPVSALLTEPGPAFGIMPPPGLLCGVSGQSSPIRVIPGPELSCFDHASQQACWGADYKISPASDRTAYRLDGAPLFRKKSMQQDMLSHAVFPGVIQVPPSGQPIVLLNDAQTTGGYPKIGVVIAADLWKLAQLPLGAHLHFVPCSTDDALLAARELKSYLNHVKQILSVHV